MGSLKLKPYFIWLFPLVFYLIQLQEYVKYVTFSKIGFDYFSITVIVLFIYFILRKIFKRHEGAFAIAYFFFLIFYFFFGNIKTALFSNSITKHISSYPILMPLLFVVLFLIFRLLKNNLKRCSQWFQYANTLTLVLIVLQTALLINLLSKPSPKIVEKIAFKKVESSFKNNIYFILMDEYAGNKSLEEFFHYDNSAFNNHLKEKGFFVSDSIHSNFNLTINSMNSILNMQYLNYTSLYPWNNYKTMYLNSFNEINKNNLIHFFLKNNYEVNNLSIFDLEKNNCKYNFMLKDKAINLIYKQIFHNKIYSDLSWILTVGKYKIDYVYNKRILETYNNNLNLYDKTIYSSRISKHMNNIFTYTHLLIPHKPYFTDSLGNLQSVILDNYFAEHTKYLDYLKFANTKMIMLTDSLIKYDSTALIIIMSDHGYRDYPDMHSNLIYNNFLAVRFPDSNYSQIDKVKSNVNVFRVILNQYFNQQLPMLKDSFFFVDEDKNKFTPLQNKQ